jgi:hypothetical protein
MVAYVYKKTNLSIDGSPTNSSIDRSEKEYINEEIIDKFRQNNPN